MKLIVTIVVTIPVNSLDQYDAVTIDEAAKNQAKWFEDGTVCLPDILDYYEQTVAVIGDAS